MAFAHSSSVNSVSYIFSPCLIPITLISLSALNNSFTALANTSIVQAGAFCTKISPLSPFSNANNTKSTASSNVITNLVIVGSVTVRSFPSFIWLIKRGTTLPLDANTFPYLVHMIAVLSGSTVLDLATITFSIIALLVPIAFTG